MTLSKLSFPILCALPLAACASASSEYPSLAIREAERVGGRLDAPAVSGPVVQAPAVSADLLEQLAQLQAQARDAHAGFVRSAPAATRTIRAARGAAIASDRWASAQIALADLDSQRSKTAVALADLEIIYTDSAIALAQRGPIGEARNEVNALIAQEDAILAQLRGILAP